MDEKFNEVKNLYSKISILSNKIYLIFKKDILNKNDLEIIKDYIIIIGNSIDEYKKKKTQYKKYFEEIKINKKYFIRDDILEFLYDIIKILFEEKKISTK